MFLIRGAIANLIRICDALCALVETDLIPGAMVADNSNREGAVNNSEQVRSGKIFAMTRRIDTRSFRLLIATENSPCDPKKHNASMICACMKAKHNKAA